MVAALFELSELYYEDDRVEECRKLIKRASGFSGYDWSDVYTLRIKFVQKQLANIKK
jgi:hypothetical protein